MSAVRALANTAFVGVALCCVLLGGCTDTLIGAFIRPTHEVNSLSDLKVLGVSLVQGEPGAPTAICASSYDREFTPWGEHYRLENWFKVSDAFRQSGLDAEAIIDVDTGTHDFGEVALIWRSDRERLKVFVPEASTQQVALGDGCRMFDESKRQDGKFTTG